MKFRISKDDLLGAINTVSKGMSSRSTLPILSGILLETTDQGKLVFQTTDLEISIKHATSANIEEPGRCVIPGKILSDIVKSLPDASIEVETKDEQTHITCLDASFTLSSLNPADFPYFPQVDPSTTIVLPPAELADAVRCVGKAVSRDESRIILTGIYLTVKDGIVTLAATDSYRLAVGELPIPSTDITDFSAIVPGKTFDEVCRLALSSDSISVGFSENQVIITFGETVFVSRKIEGTYPNYKQLIPADHEVSIQMDTQALITSIKRVAILAQSHTPIRFQFSAESQNVTISANTADVGGASEVVPAEVDGPSMEIAFNHQYILDGLNMIRGDVLIELQSSLKPGILKNVDKDDFLYLAMPVRLN